MRHMFTDLAGPGWSSLRPYLLSGVPGKGNDPDRRLALQLSNVPQAMGRNPSSKHYAQVIMNLSSCIATLFAN